MQWKTLNLSSVLREDMALPHSACFALIETWSDGAVQREADAHYSFMCKKALKDTGLLVSKAELSSEALN